jgi:hypothetical protein
MTLGKIRGIYEYEQKDYPGALTGAVEELEDKSNSKSR